MLREEYIFSKAREIFRTIISSETDFSQIERNEIRNIMNVAFKKGQLLLLNILKDIELEIRNAKEFIKKNPQTSDSSKRYLIRLKYYDALFRKLADTIAWSVIGIYNSHVAKRLYHSQNAPSLLSSGSDEVINMAEVINADPESFALISDITSLIQVGDLFVSHPEGHMLVEVKSGEKNEKAFEILKGIYDMKANCSMSPNIEESIKYNAQGDKGFQKQMERMHRQKQRSTVVSDVYKKDVIDLPLERSKLRIATIPNLPKLYLPIIREMIDESLSNNWSYRVVDDCLHIGVFREQWRNSGYSFLNTTISGVSGRYFPVCDFLDGIKVPLTIPIFILSLPEKTIFEIIEGEIKIFMSLNIDKFIEKCNLRWATRKETEKFCEQNRHGIFKFEKTGITSDGIENFMLGDSFMTRIFFDLNTPDFVAHCTIETIKQFENMMDDDESPNGNTELRV